MKEEPKDRIVPLDELDDVRVARGDADVRGWDVIAADGRKVGEVDDLLVDTRAMKVRYLDVDVDDDLVRPGAGDHMLLPVGYARLDEKEKRVVIDQLASRDLAAVPGHGGRVTREYETSVRRHFDRDYPRDRDEEDRSFYAGDLYDEDRFYGRGREAPGERRMVRSEEELAVGKREVEAGAVDLDKHVETEHVRRSVPVRHDEVTVERRPVTGTMSLEPHVEGDEIHIPITEEELVVEKRTVVKEELVVKKRQVEEEKIVEADLRKERVDVEKEGDVRVRDAEPSERRD